MTTGDDAFARSIGFGERALEQINAHQVSAYPRMYELWYTYAAGLHPVLNKALDKILRGKRRLPAQDLEEIYDDFLSPQRFTAKVDHVSSRLTGEMNLLAELVDGMRDDAGRYSGALREAATHLSPKDVPEQFHGVIESLIGLTAEMADANRKLEGLLQVSRNEIGTLQQALHSVVAESLTDPLTSLHNRKAFDAALKSGVTDARASGETLVLLIVDIDHFKRFNDAWGHLTGDQVLKLVAQSIKQNVKGGDLAARYGGEEFAIILLNTNLRSARTVGEHIRRAVMTRELVKRTTGENIGKVTLSIGMATLQPNDTATSLFERADGCLYAAKKAGRNRVVCETDPEYENDRIPS